MTLHLFSLVQNSKEATLVLLIFFSCLRAFKEASNENPAHENETDRKSRSETEVSFAPRSSSSSNEDDDKDGDPRRRTSKKDGQDVRGRTPRIDTSKTSEKLFKTDPPRSTPTREN